MKTIRQRDKMRELAGRYKINEERIVREYASAEARGEVMRTSNIHGIPAYEFARRLLRDGQLKGWL